VRWLIKTADIKLVRMMFGHINVHRSQLRRFRMARALSTRQRVRMGPRPERSVAITPMLCPSRGHRTSIGIISNEVLHELQNGLRTKPGLGRLANALPEQFFGLRGLDLATAIGRDIRHERSEALPAIDDAFALEFLVCALDGDDADEQVFGESPKRRKR
jgi:hypothetical protein